MTGGIRSDLSADELRPSARVCAACWRGVGRRLKAAARALRQLLGMPDYDRYVAHMQAQHPGSPLLSAREFHADAIERRYGGSRPKCC